MTIAEGSRQYVAVTRSQKPKGLLPLRSAECPGSWQPVQLSRPVNSGLSGLDSAAHGAQEPCGFGWGLADLDADRF